MVNIKAYKDGDRLVLVVENCVGETAIKVNSFVSSLLGIIEEPIDVPYVSPVKVKEEPFLIPNEPINEIAPFDTPIVSATTPKGESVDEIIRSQGISAAIKFMDHKYARDVVRKDLLERNPETASSFEIKEFVNLYHDLIKDSIKTLLNMAGYETFDDFLSFSDEETIKDGYAALIASIDVV